MKRYDMQASVERSGQCLVEMEENSRGDWVKFDDAQSEIEDLNFDIDDLKRHVKSLQDELEQAKEGGE